MAWVYLLIAGCLEVIGVILMNEWSRTKHKIFILLIGIAFVCSFSTFYGDFRNVTISALIRLKKEDRKSKRHEEITF